MLREIGHEGSPKPTSGSSKSSIEESAMTRLSAVSLPHFLLLASMLPSQYWAWMATTRITYCFLFPDGRSRVYEVVLDAETGRQVSVPLGSHHAWTDLEYEKCRHCPLKREEHPDCPAAKNLAFVFFFKQKTAYEITR